MARLRRQLPWLLVAGALFQAACGVAPEDTDGVVAHGMTFDEWVATLPFDDGTGAYVVEDDILVYERGDLTDYYAASLYGTALTLGQSGSGLDHKHSVSRALDLTYCVDDAFGADKASVRATFASAAQEWMDATKTSRDDAPTIRFRHEPDEDDECTPFNDRVFFNVSPSTSNKFDAGSFLPHYSRGNRQLLITPRAIEPYKDRTFLGVLRHEVGHMLGFKHEHINAPGTPCPEDDADWRPLTEYDMPSVMHYRTARSGVCMNSGALDYALTTLDNAGVRCVYTTQARSAKGTAGDACRALTSYSSAATDFAIDGHGQLYRLSQTSTSTHKTSTVARYLAPGTTKKQGWTTLWHASEPNASATSAIFAGGTQLYRRAGERLYRWDAGAWAEIEGGPGSATSVTYSSGDLFRLNATGTIDRVPAGQARAMRILSTGASGRRIFVGTTELYRVEANGEAYVWAAGAWSGRIGTGIREVAKTESGSVFCLLDDAAGTVMLRKAGGAWSTIGAGARTIWGGLEVPYMSLKDNPSTALDESTVIARNPSGSTWHRYALSSRRIMKGDNRRIVIRTNGRPYAYATP